MLTQPMLHQDCSSRSLLQSQAVKQQTLRRYADDVSDFVKWATQRRLVVDTEIDLDYSLASYFNFLFVDRGGVGKGAASNVYNGVRFFLPEFELKLGAAAQALKGWRKAMPTRSFPPLTWSCTVAIAVQMVRHGRLDMGIATLLAFDSLLRIGDVVGLFKEDVLFGNGVDARVDARYKGTGVRIRTAKTGNEQWADVDNADVRVLLEAHAKTRPARSKLFSFTAAQFRRLFKIVCSELGLPSSIVPHSLRHGGATLLFLLGVPMDVILVRGRWAEHKSARRYIQSGRSLLLAMSIPRDIALAGQLLAKNIPRSFAEAQCGFGSIL